MGPTSLPDLRPYIMKFAMKRHSLIFLVLLVVVAFPRPAWANAGTPLPWTRALWR